MRIVKATVGEKEQLHRYFKEAYPNKSGELIDAQFRVHFNPEDIYLYKKGDEIVSVAHISERVLSLNGKNLRTAYVSNAFTRQVHQGKGYMSKFLGELLDEVGRKSLITLLRAYEPSIYESLGFERVLEVAKYRINALDIKDFGVSGILLAPKSEDLLMVYKEYTDHFDGYFVRDESYFDTLKQDYSKRTGDVVGLVVGGKLVGYCVYDVNGMQVEVKECVYDKAGTLMRLLSYVSKGKTTVTLWSSEAENISKVFPKAKRSTQPYLSARLNDKDLFERLYDIRVISAYSAFNAFDKPLFNRDFD